MADDNTQSQGGAPTTQICVQCGKANALAARFCDHCGSSLVSAPPLAGGQSTVALPQPPYPQQSQYSQYPQYPPQQPQYPQYQQPPYPQQPQQPQQPQYQYQQTPPQVQQQYQRPYPVKKQRNPCGCCLVIALISLVLLCGTGGVLYFMIQNGTINQRQILNAMGLGTGEAAVLNLTDGDLSVSMISLSSEAGSSSSESTLTLKPTDSKGFTTLQAGRYRVSFASTVGAGANGDCTLQVSSGDVYQFVALNEGVVVTNEKFTPKTSEDLNIVTSELCKK